MDFGGVGYLVIPLYELLQQVAQVLITWNNGFFVLGTWLYSGTNRWCYYSLLKRYIETAGQITYKITQVLSIYVQSKKIEFARDVGFSMFPRTISQVGYA